MKCRHCQGAIEIECERWIHSITGSRSCEIFAAPPDDGSGEEWATCPACEGDGVVDLVGGDVEECAACGGGGFTTRQFAQEVEESDYRCPKHEHRAMAQRQFSKPDPKALHDGR